MCGTLNMKGVKDLLESERGAFCLMLLIAATILTVLKIITGADWMTFAKYLAITLVASKTATGALEAWISPAPPPTAQT